MEQREQVCRVCGCSFDNACLVDLTGYEEFRGIRGPYPTCWWVEPDLCSGCAYGITVRGPVRVEGTNR